MRLIGHPRAADEDVGTVEAAFRLHPEVREAVLALVKRDQFDLSAEGLFMRLEDDVVTLRWSLRSTNGGVDTDDARRRVIFEAVTDIVGTTTMGIGYPIDDS